MDIPFMKKILMQSRATHHILIILFFLSLLSPVGPFPAFSQQPAVSDRIGGSESFFSGATRRFVDLSGSWNYSEEGADGGTITVPSLYEGAKSITFRRDFDLPQDIFSASSFQFISLGINYYCEIKINGQFVGKHAGATPFQFKITDHLLRPGANSIEILVQNRLNVVETVPLTEQLRDPQNYGGLFRSLGILVTGAVWSQDGRIDIEGGINARQTDFTFSAMIHSGNLAALKADSGRQAGRLDKRTIEHSFEVIDKQTGLSVYKSAPRPLNLESDRSVPINVSFSLAEPKLWSPSAPNLYILRQVITGGGRILDEVAQTVGFRKLETKNGLLLVNGEPTPVKGIVCFEYAPNTGGALSDEDMERDILLVKNLGANTIRVAAASINPSLLSLCDRYGLMLFCDLPLWRTPSSLLTHPSIQSTALNLVQDMGLWYASHPCVAALGIAQGIDARTPGFAEYAARVLPAVRTRPSFLVYASFATHRPAEIPEGLDFVSIDIPVCTNAQAAGILEEMKSLAQEIHRPVLIGSLEHPVEPGNYTGYSDPRSIDAQGKFFLDIYPRIQREGYAGCIVNALTDWRAARPSLNRMPAFQQLVTNGLLDQYRQKRIAYDVIKALFNGEKTPALVIGSFTEVYPPVFIIVGILLIFGFALLYNLFKRFRENVVRAIMRPYNFFADIRDQRMLSTFQTTMIGLLGAVSAALYAANMLYYWRYSYHFDFMLSQFVRSAGGKELVDFCGWNPLAGIALGSLIAFGLLLLYALMLRLLALLLRRKLLLFDTYSVSMWSLLPMIFLAPIGMILHRIMSIGAVDVIALALFLFLNLWIRSRLFKGTAIVLEARTPIAYAIGFAALILIAGIWVVSLDRQYAIFDYLQYGWNVHAGLHLVR